MSKFKDIIDFILKVKDILLVLAFFILWIFNFWFSYKSATINQNIATLDSKVSANSDRISVLEGTSEDTNNKVTEIQGDTTKIKCYLLGEDCLR